VIDFIKNNFLDKSFLKFVIIGGINTLNGSVLAFLYSYFMQANLAFIVGYITALVVAYFLNSFFVFKASLDITRFVKFAVSYIPNFIIQNIVVVIIYNILGLHRLIAFVMAAAIGIPVTFLILKFFAFGKNNKKE